MDRQRKIRVGLVLWFTLLLSILAVQLYHRDEPLYCTVKERRDAQRLQELEREIEQDVQQQIDKHMQP